MNTINSICQSDVLGNDCEPIGLLVGSCNDVQDTSAAAARKDQNSKRGCGSQRCHPTAPQCCPPSFTVATHKVLGSIYPGKRPASTSWSWTSLKLPKSCAIDAEYVQTGGSSSIVFIHYIRILSSVTMPTCDVLLRHFRKMLLYTQGYAVAYSHLLYTLAGSHMYVLCCGCKVACNHVH